MVIFDDQQLGVLVIIVGFAQPTFEASCGARTSMEEIKVELWGGTVGNECREALMCCEKLGFEERK